MMTADVIKVFLADDHVMVREGLAALISHDPQIQIVGQCGDGLKVLEQVHAAQPHVVILDVMMPGLNGLDLCRELSRTAKTINVLVLTMCNDEQFIARSLEYGASGYLLKESAADQLIEAVRTVARGELFLGPGIHKGVLSRLGGQNSDPHEKLTTRERQVLQLIAEGKTNRQISEELDVAIKTIDTHRSRLMRKLGIHDQTSLVKYALRRGIVSLQ